MPTQPGLFPPLPNDTIHAAETISAKSSYRIIGDQIEQLFTDVELARLDPSGTQSASTLASLALITVFQFTENLPDQRAVEALRTRPDWKYALHLPRNYPGFESAVLCTFRKLLVRDPIARQVFQQVLDCLVGTELLRSTEASAVLAVVCGVSHLERLWEAMRMVLEALAAVAPEQLRTITLPHWYERYSQMQALRVLPQSVEEQSILAQAIGTDATYLLEAITRAANHLISLPEIQALHQILLEQFERSRQHLQWRASTCAVCCST